MGGRGEGGMVKDGGMWWRGQAGRGVGVKEWRKLEGERKEDGGRGVGRRLEGEGRGKG